jgi:drug/metabolite transporter (DMT)-like permease
MKSLSRQYTAITLSMIFWSLSFVWFKVANKYYSPITIIFIRLCIAIGLLSIFLWLSHGFQKIRREDRKYFLLLAVCEPFLYFLGESFGLTFVSSTVGSVIISTIPLFAILVAWVFFREKLSIINYVGAVVSFIGLIVFLSDSNGTISINSKGLLLLFLAVFSAVGYNMVLHRLAPKYNAVLIVCIQSAIGAVLFLPLFLIFDLKNFLSIGFIAEGFTSIVLLSLFASSAAFALYAYSVKYLGMSLANVFCNLIPVFTAIFAFLIINEIPTIQNIAGMIIAVAGLFLSQKGSNKIIKADEIDLSGKSA